MPELPEDKKTINPAEAVSSEKNMEEKLVAFREEIAAVKEGEAERKTAHFLGHEFRGEDLTADDEEMWEKLKNKTLEWKEFYEYRTRLIDEERNKPGAHPNTRELFFAYFANMATPILVEKQRS